MLRATALGLACLLLSGCAGTLPWQEQPKPSPPVIPQSCLTQCRDPVDLCLLPSWFDQASDTEQAAVVIQCTGSNSKAYQQCFERHEKCREWAEKQVQPADD